MPCLTFSLVLTSRPILALPEYNLKVVNIHEMQGTRVLKLWCYVFFEGFLQYVQFVRKSDERCAINLLVSNIINSGVKS